MTVAERTQERERELSRELIEKYAGDWVAVRGHHIIAHAASAHHLDEQLTQEHLPYRTFRISRGAGVTLLSVASA